jgi:hypothetical protein
MNLNVGLAASMPSSMYASFACTLRLIDDVAPPSALLPKLPPPESLGVERTLLYRGSDSAIGLFLQSVDVYLRDAIMTG